MTEIKSGIYIIINIVNGKYYIGQAQDINRRWQTHQSNLSRNINEPNEYLQNAWNKYGKDNFYFGILEPVDDLLKLTEREQYWLDELGAYNHTKGYNIRKKAESNHGIKYSLESRAKMSASRKGRKSPLFGRKHSEEAKKKMSTSRKGRFKGENSPMHGRHPTEETRKKMSIARKRRKNSPEARAKMSISTAGEKHPMYGKHHSEDTRKKMSISHKPKYFEFNGEKHTIPEWANILGINRTTLNTRLTRLGWTIEQALTPTLFNKECSEEAKVKRAKARNPRYFEFNGEKHTVREWANILGINKHTLLRRLNGLGWSTERAFTTK